MFNSGLLKDYVNQMMSAGRRNIAIDLSPLDYIYSDSINVLMTLNKRALELSGRVTLLTPQAEVVGIIQKAGIPNVMRVFGGEAELLLASDEIMASSPGFKVGSLAGIADALDRGPQSEFESLRSEIGSVMGGDGMMQGPAAPQPAPPPITIGQGPAAPFAPPLPSKAPAFPPPAAPVAPAPAPAAPSGFGEFGTQAKGPELGDDFDNFGTGAGKKKKGQKVKAPDDDFDNFAEDTGKKKKDKAPIDEFAGDFDEDFATPQKKVFPLVPIIAGAAVLIIGLVVILVLSSGKGDKTPEAPVAVAPVVPPPEPPPQEPAEEKTPAPAEIQVVEAPATPAPAPTPPPPPPPAPAKTATPSKTPAKAATPAAKAPAPPPPVKAPAPAAKAPTPPPPAKAPPPPPPPAKAATPAPPPAQRNQIVITSTPSGATVEVDGERKGTTPFTWTTPFFGDMSIAVSRPGFTTETRNIDYSGGSVSYAFNLRQAPAAPPPPPPPPPQPQAPPPQPQPAARPQPPPQQQQQQPARPSGASIFIATLPSHADVYIGGRLVGKSNDGELQVPVGTHQVRFVKGDVEKTETITFQPGKNPTRFVPLKSQ